MKFLIHKSVLPEEKYHPNKLYSEFKTTLPIIVQSPDAETIKDVFQQANKPWAKQLEGIAILQGQQKKNVEKTFKDTFVEADSSYGEELDDESTALILLQYGSDECHLHFMGPYYVDLDNIKGLFIRDDFYYDPNKLFELVDLIVSSPIKQRAAFKLPRFKHPTLKMILKQCEEEDISEMDLMNFLDTSIPNQLASIPSWLFRRMMFFRGVFGMWGLQPEVQPADKPTIPCSRPR